MVELFFNQIAGINSRPATLLKISLRWGGFSVNTLEFSALLQTGLTWALLSSTFDKISGFVLQGLNFIKTFSIIDFFLKIFFLRQLLFDTYCGKNLWWSLFIEELQSGHCRHTTLLKNSIIDAFLRNLQTFVIIYFLQHFHLCWGIKLHERLPQSQAWSQGRWKTPSLFP